MAVPKRKTSKSRQRSRAANFRAEAPQLGPCPQCRSPRLPHRMCPSCGHYRGREIIKVKDQ